MRRGLAAMLLLAAAIGSARPCAADADAAVQSVANIDIMPGEVAGAHAAFEAYLTAARTDPGVASVGLVLQDGTENHFMLLQRFADRTAFDAHLRQPYVRAFRAALFPHLGSPYDERVGTNVGS